MKSKDSNPIELDTETVTEITEIQADEIAGGSCWFFTCNGTKKSLDTDD